MQMPGFVYAFPHRVGISIQDSSARCMVQGPLPAYMTVEYGNDQDGHPLELEILTYAAPACSAIS